MITRTKTSIDGVSFVPKTTSSLEPNRERLDGQTIAGRYRILKELGAGGMGAVYLAEQITFGRNVALKILHEKYTLDQGIVQRFRREARLLGALNHPNIITVHDFDQAENGRLFIAMELVDGGTLREAIQGGPLALEEAIQMGLQIAEGLLAAHRIGVIHRDVKPENILVSRDTNQVKVTDLGIACIRDAEASTKLTQTGMIVGTPAYMAPEQIEDKELTNQTDIYAFGIMLYEMMSGKPPFTAASATGLLMKHIAETPVPLRIHRGEVPLCLERLVMQMLEKAPERRPNGMDEVLTELRKAGCSPHEEVPITLALPDLRRRKTAAGLWLAGIVVILMGALASFGSFITGNFVSSPAVELQTLSIQSPKYQMDVGETITVRAHARYTDGKESLVSEGVRWDSSDPSVFVISPQGQVEGRLAGTADIVARVGDIAAPSVRMSIKEKPAPGPESGIDSAVPLSPAQEPGNNVKEANKSNLTSHPELPARESTAGIEKGGGAVSNEHVGGRGRSEPVKPGPTTSTSRNRRIETEAVTNNVRGKHNDELIAPFKKKPAEQEPQSVAKDRPQLVERPNQSAVETPVQVAPPEQTEAVPLVPPRDPRQVISDYIRSEKQRRGR